MSSSERMSRGREIRRELYGDGATDELDAQLYANDPIMTKFGDLTQELTFGSVWSRSGLDLRMRSLITAVSDVATGETEALAIHLRFCRRHGWTEDELVEMILHLMSYVGIPTARRSLVVATKVFAELRQEEGVGS